MKAFFFPFFLSAFFFFSPLKNLPILFFVPFLAYFSSLLSFLPLLWLSFIIGFLVDLFSTGPLGENATIYLLSTILVLREKKFLLDERPWYLALFAFAFSAVCEICRWICFLKTPISFKNLAFSVFSFSFCTAIYAIIGFMIPLLLWNKGALFVKRIWYKRKRS